MKKIIEWLLSSHRWLHILIGLLVGFGAKSLYCALYVGLGIAATSELKDKLWGGLWDFTDFILTIVAVLLGYVIHGIVFGFILFN